MHRKEPVRRMAIPMLNEEGEQCEEQLSMTARKKGLPVFLQPPPLALYVVRKAECSQKYTTKTSLPFGRGSRVEGRGYVVDGRG